jgi:hypothetical protein
MPLAAIDIPRDGFTGGTLCASMGGVCAVGSMSARRISRPWSPEPNGLAVDLGLLRRECQ